MLKALAIKGLTTLLGASLASSGLAAAGVPGVPNPVAAVVEVATNGPDTQGSHEGDLPEEAEAGQETADQKKTAAECTAENAKAQGDDATRQQGEFDPKCEGLTDVPDQAADEGKEHSDSGPDTASEHQPTDVPDADSNPSSDAPDGQTEDVPNGQPTDTPTGKP